MNNSPLLNKSLDFATEVVLFHEYDSMLSLANEIRRMLISSLNTAKSSPPD